MKEMYTEDGLVIEGYGPGGHVLVVQKETVEWSDVLPYFTPCAMIITAFLFFLLTGNLLLLMGLVLAYDLYGVF